MEIRAIIVDDERNARELLSLLLSRIAPQVSVTAMCASVAEARRAIDQYDPDLIFLDVEMPEETGFTLLDLEDGKFTGNVIFTTAYDQYALKAIKKNAIDYLLKPIVPDDLLAAVKKVTRRVMEGKTTNHDWLLQQIKKIHVTPRIGIPTVTGVVFIEVSQIIRCEADSNYTVIHFNEGPKMVVSRSLKEMEAVLQPYNFWRIHKSHLIATSWIKAYRKGDNSAVTLSDGAILPVSKFVKSAFELQLNLI